MTASQSNAVFPVSPLVFRCPIPVWLWSHKDSPSCGPILEEQGLPVPHHLPCKLGQKGAVLLLSVSWSYHFCFLDRKQNETQTIPAPAGIQACFISLLFPSLCFQSQFSSTAWTAEQKPHHNPPLLFLLLVNYFISSLCILTGVFIFHGNCIHNTSPLRNPRCGVLGGPKQPNPPSYKQKWAPPSDALGATFPAGRGGAGGSIPELPVPRWALWGRAAPSRVGAFPVVSRQLGSISLGGGTQPVHTNSQQKRTPTRTSFIPTNYLCRGAAIKPTLPPAQQRNSRET